MPIINRRDGKLFSMKLEYNLTEHCNYGCNECSHFSPHMPRGQSNIATFTRDLASLSQVMQVYRFRFVGGEPLLHKDLFAHIQAVRESGIAQEVQACTNGAFLDKVDDETLAALDTLTISWYPDPRVDQALIDRTISRCQRIGTKIGVLKIDSFRRMQLVRPTEDREILQDIFNSCEIAHVWYCQTFYQGRFYLCSRPLFTGTYLQKVNSFQKMDFREADGIAIHEPDLASRLEAHLTRKEPLQSCRYCLGTVGVETPWRQLSPAERKKPNIINESASLLIDRGKLARTRIKCKFPLRAALLFLPRSFSVLAAKFSRSLSQD